MSKQDQLSRFDDFDESLSFLLLHAFLAISLQLHRLYSYTTLRENIVCSIHRYNMTVFKTLSLSKWRLRNKVGENTFGRVLS